MRGTRQPNEPSSSGETCQDTLHADLGTACEGALCKHTQRGDSLPGVPFEHVCPADRVTAANDHGVRDGVHVHNAENMFLTTLLPSSRT